MFREFRRIGVSCQVNVNGFSNLDTSIFSSFDEKMDNCLLVFVFFYVFAFNNILGVYFAIDGRDKNF
jgi:hypothetical protein